MTRRLGGFSAPLLVTVLSGACGGGGSPATATTPTTLAPTPSPSPSPTPPTGCTPGGDCSNNQSPVARVILRIYRVWDNKNHVVPTPDPYHEVLREPIPVYYCLLFDITGRDEHGYETQGPGGDGHGIVWLPSDDLTLQYGGELSTWQHKFCAVNPGKMSMCAKWDGVYSNCIAIKVVPCEAARSPYLCN